MKLPWKLKFPCCNGRLPFTWKRTSTCPKCGRCWRYEVRNKTWLLVYLAVLGCAEVALGFIATKGVISAQYFYGVLFWCHVTALVIGIVIMSRFGFREVNAHVDKHVA